MGLLTVDDLSGTPHALRSWGSALAARDPGLIASLYARKSILLSTLDPVPKLGRHAITGYFADLVKRRGLHVVFQQVWSVGNGVYTGLYRFTWKDGDLPARFTFVVGPEGITHHHSSQLP
jgi:hypothetical protein